MTQQIIKPMVNRRYLVTVRVANGDYEYVERTGDNKDIVYGNACAEFGFANVGGVYVYDSADIALERLRIKGIKAMIERGKR